MEQGQQPSGSGEAGGLTLEGQRLRAAVYLGARLREEGREALGHLHQAGQPQRTNDFVVAWENIYQGKTRVFSTTIGHNNETVSDARYLDLVTRGLLWACDKLDTDGKPKPGYAAK